jgi:hypothetical protein
VRALLELLQAQELSWCLPRRRRGRAQEWQSDRRNTLPSKG